MSYEMTLSNGRKLTGLELSGNSWLSSEELSREDFRGGLRVVTVTGSEPGEGESDPRGEYRELRLEGIFRLGEKTCFVVNSSGVTEEERLRSDVDYLAMMLEVEL